MGLFDLFKKKEEETVTDVNPTQGRAKAAEVPTSGVTYKVATRGTNLNCRKDPDIKSEIVGKFANGSEVSLVEKHSDKWHLVKNAEVSGYCHTDWLELVSNA
ncbi:MAG: SH3 domain-containing protein [Bacteroidia bacterium]|jgi:uncharacterized protein YgiM (DUF1202 family)|tara:strand:+ start:11086 stop:11391 length:306 start_codon:yes stop_codon:yes gene_type:complete